MEEIRKKLSDKRKSEENQNNEIALEIMGIFKSNKISYRQAVNILDTVSKYAISEAIIQ